MLLLDNDDHHNNNNDNSNNNNASNSNTTNNNNKDMTLRAVDLKNGRSTNSLGPRLNLNQLRISLLTKKWS